MDNAGYAALQIIPSFDGMESRLERGLRGPLSSAGSRGGRVFGDSAGRSIASTMSTHVKRAAVLAAGVLSGAAVAGTALVRASFGEAREAQKVGALTASTLKATGGAANIGAKGIDRLSGALSRKAAIDDEVIQSGLNMLLTFKNVRNEAGKGNDIFNQAGATITDMAAAMAASSGGEVDLKSASIQVGKALNDPIKGISALSRVGVTFTDQQKEQIKALVESGNTLDAQKIILRELSSEFGGAAHSQATDADRVSVAWGNMEEKLGVALLPLMKDFNRFLLRDAIPTFDGWVDTFEEKGVPALKHFFDKAKPVAEDMLPKLADILGTVRDVLSDAAPYAKDLVDAFVDMPDWAKKAIVGGGLAAFAANKVGAFNLLGNRGGVGNSGSGLLGLVSQAKPVPVWVVKDTSALGGLGIPGGGKGGPKAGPQLPLLGMPILPGAAPDAIDLPDKIGSAEEFWEVTHPHAEADLRQLLLGPIDDADKGLDRLGKKKVEPKFTLDGLAETFTQLDQLREKAERPMHAQLVLNILGNTLTDLGLGAVVPDNFDDKPTKPGRHKAPPPPTSGRTVNVNVENMTPYDYRGMMTEVQHRAQQAAVGAIGVLP